MLKNGGKMLRKEPYFEYKFSKTEVEIWLLSYNDTEKQYILSKTHSISIELWNELENKLYPIMNRYPTFLKFHVIVGSYLYLLKRKDYLFNVKELENENFSAKDLIMFSSYATNFINSYVKNLPTYEEVL